MDVDGEELGTLDGTALGVLGDALGYIYGLREYQRVPLLHPTSQPGITFKENFTK